MSFNGSVPVNEKWRHFDFWIEDGVATLTFTRPDRLNALTFEVYADLRDLFGQIPHRDDIDVLIITGQGRAFCSGGDVNDIIGELVEYDAKQLLEFTRMTGHVIQNMRECPIPIIAAVNGTAAGAGAVIALASDFRIVVPGVQFRFLFTKVGLSGGDMGSAYLLPRVVGLGRATEILMLGEPVGAEKAVEIGLANWMVEAGELLDTANDLARRLADGPRFGYAMTKLLLSREQDMDLAGALEYEAMTQALLMGSEDHKEFHRAFTSGQQPKWTGR
ncbi:MAG: enoyl-CoA hydratase family protein [Acidimicrobiia bacterium]|nr:enoyl-CoA hydratase family protein [Acidimicrobiia bacterium]